MDKSFKEMDPTTTQPRTLDDLDNEDDCASLEPPPPQVDGGKDVWCFLAAVFLFEAVIWGFPYTFGIFQEHYMSHPLFQGSSGISAIGSTALGLMYFPAPLLSIALQRWPFVRKLCMISGLIITVAALLGASFCSTVPGLIGCQGVLFAVGGILAYFPGMQIIDQWFVKRRATAFAFVWAAAPLAGAVIPFAMQWLLDTYSFRTALRVYAVTVVVLLSPAACFIKPPLPEKKGAATPCLGFAFFKHPCLWWYIAGTLIQSFGFFLPSLWIPTFATDYDFAAVAGPLALALYNASAFIGTVAQGWLVDRYHVQVDLAIATIISAISVFVFWGLATIQPIFYLFAILWGVSGGAYNATWAGYAFDLKAEGFDVDTTFIISLMVTSKGVASITSGPLSEVLYGLDLGGGAGFAYGGPYAAMIIYTGLCSLLGGVACLRPRKRRNGWA